MNLSTCCSLNPLPPISTLDPSSSPSLLTRNNLSRKPNEKSSSSSSSWSKKMMVIATTVVLSLEVGDIISNNMNGSYYDATASEIGKEFEIPKDKMEKKVTRWSDQRSCPPWNISSLETIVPENLPRPYFHRKWEKVSYSSKFVSPNSAPPIEFLVRPKKSCFSL